MNPAVVVIAYDRPEALQRLLTSLSAAEYPPGADVPLVISIDQGGARSGEVASLARSFEWRSGAKEVIEQPVHLGLVAHFRECGRLSQRFGGVVLLEDDLVVAPPFYGFAAEALHAYANDERIAGLCLYGLWFNGFTQEPFQPLEDGCDVFFLGLPYTQGLAFGARQWQRFEAWWEGNRPGEHRDLHPSFLRFGKDEWFPALAAYTAEAGRYFCFPRVSLTTGWGDAGAHFAAPTDWLQTPLQLRGGEYRLPPLEESLAVYDSFFELTPDRLRALAPQLAPVEFDVDLYATKQPANLRHEHVLTTRPVRRAQATYGLQLWPPELNLVQAVPGLVIALAHRDDVYWDRWASLEARRRLHQRAWARHRPSRQRSLGFALGRIVQAVRGKPGKGAGR